ncbi:MAG: hypothetical protein IJL48_02465 [Bacteroidales bacterium]|nr:hypothetical protein [Bacteroidales bacterium]MBR5352568.1 hypothetical protein [Bacteroidales bacterium]
MRKMLFLLLAIATSATAWSQTQPDYIPEQLGRDAHHIIQSLGAFVGNERAESQSFDITYMPAGNGVEGVMIINTADYRCTFKLDAEYEMCYELTIDIRSKEFLDQFYNLFAVYRTENQDDHRIMSFGNEKLRITENPSTTSRYRSFKFTINQ